MKNINILKLALSIAICQSAGIIGSVFTVSAISTWYSTLTKPSFSPPNFVFGPVWITLYTLMGISLYLIWSAYTKAKKGKNKKEIKSSLNIFGIHLALNAAWTIIFFGLRNPFLAFLEIIVLWVFILVIIYRFWQIDKRSGYLLIPYLLWVTIAMSLNYNIWRLNP